MMYEDIVTVCSVNVESLCEVFTAKYHRRPDVWRSNRCILAVQCSAGPTCGYPQPLPHTCWQVGQVWGEESELSVCLHPAAADENHINQNHIELRVVHWFCNMRFMVKDFFVFHNNLFFLSYPICWLYFEYYILTASYLKWPNNV